MLEDEFISADRYMILGVEINVSLLGIMRTCYWLLLDILISFRNKVDR
jgi:hypothetical protein